MMENMYVRTELLLGKAGVERLKAAHIAVFGIGGVGSFTAEALARAGVGSLTLVDRDTVSESNLNRQIIALHSTIGRPKATVMKERIADINPKACVRAVEAFCLPENVKDFFDCRYDYVVDAVDTVAAKLALAEITDLHGIPIISAMGAGNKLHPELFEVADIYQTSVCPLCRVMRRELKKRGIERMKVVYSKEEPIKSESTEHLAGKPVPGSISFVPSVSGLLIAGEVIRDLTAK